MQVSLHEALGNRRRLVITVVLLLVAVLSATVLSGFFAASESYSEQYQILDEKRNNVLALTAASAGAATVVSLLPDDAGTPIAEQLAEISKGFGIVVGGILLEKYLLTTLGFAFFSIVIPVSCILFAVSRYLNPLGATRQAVQNAAAKFFIFGLVLFISVPASIFISSKIDDTYKTSIEETVGAAEEAAKSVEEATTTESDQKSESNNVLDVISNKFDEAQKAVGNVVQGAAGALDWARAQVTSFIELFAVMVVTSVVIPILVPIAIYLAFKTLFNPQQIVVQPAAMQLPAEVPGGRSLGQSRLIGEPKAKDVPANKTDSMTPDDSSAGEGAE